MVLAAVTVGVQPTGRGRPHDWQTARAHSVLSPPHAARTGEGVVGAVPGEDAGAGVDVGHHRLGGAKGLGGGDLAPACCWGAGRDSGWRDCTRAQAARGGCSGGSAGSPRVRSSCAPVAGGAPRVGEAADAGVGALLLAVIRAGGGGLLHLPVGQLKEGRPEREIRSGASACDASRRRQHSRRVSVRVRASSRGLQLSPAQQQ